MSRLIWSPSALRDVQRLYRFLAEKNRDAARRAVQAIRTSVLIIAEHPEVGRPADEMDPRFREWLIDFSNSGYVVLYHYDGNEAVIVAVRHQREAGY
ncbi:MAG: type II toxin-antitoxin system RelE/ParE family toxin [Desulforhopalus sp.]|nr:type II toxin-antitoxin system RelE/ParE family toxin [Desulforhopalus sp.]